MPGSLQSLDVNFQIPYHFRCPISLELMTDPVTVCTGQTYDRCSIESWTSTGHATCPVTRLPLTDFTLIPNHTLRRLIQAWCVAHRPYGVQRIPTPKQPADPATVRSLLNQAGTESCASLVRLTAVKRLASLARDSDKNRTVLVQSQAREVFIGVLFSISNSSHELETESLAVLSMLSLSESECALILSDPNRVNYLISGLDHSSIEVRVNSASLIENLLALTKSNEIRAEISKHEHVFERIVGILNYIPTYPRAMKVAIKALFALCLVKEHRHKAVSAGAAEAIICNLSDFEKCDAERALAIVELLCRVPEGCAAFAAHALTVPVLVKIVLKVSDRATEYATGALLSLCSGVERVRDEAVAVGVVTQLLLVVQSDCTERAKRKAQKLLKLLRDSWPDKTVRNSDDYFACSDVVPF